MLVRWGILVALAVTVLQTRPVVSNGQAAILTSWKDGFIATVETNATESTTHGWKLDVTFPVKVKNLKMDQAVLTGATGDYHNFELSNNTSNGVLTKDDKITIIIVGGGVEDEDIDRDLFKSQSVITFTPL
ncbi:uncharacterized protein LOC100369307 [Saccoglossus kowalevskii]|uniref:Uncharacterized protein LOC100369307 n=1 Tax=Saccoglossus kowalevskii TaxID=10224 RepID=A0ABM0GLZ9_SACKO|nr:PREDICTED: uncharacterized protein LOC100369307 [Saccoglossus kowalevskii]